jgi:F0F1-type ATP synthase membrane subunit b/b'
MSEHSLSTDLGYEGQFALERRGYSRLQVDETVAELRLEARGLLESRRDLEDRLSQALDESERLKLELSAARSAGRPPHQEISERIGQILQLADDEAKSQRIKAEEEIARLRAEAQAETAKLRADVKTDTDRSRADAQEQAERMLSAAQEQAEATVATAKAEAETTRKSAAAEAQQVISEATRQAETALASAKSQAKQQLDEATARASAIHDGAERRLNLLTSRHTETLRRMTEIRDVVTTLVAGETDRGSLEDEVARIVAGGAGSEGQPGPRPGAGRPGGADGGRHASGLSPADGHPALSTAHRPGMPSRVSSSSAGGRATQTPARGAGQGNGQREAWTQPGSGGPPQPDSASGTVAARPGSLVPPADQVPAPDSGDTSDD